MKGSLHKKILLIALLANLLVFIWLGSALADTYEYITHGGYDAAVEAWKRVALLFSSSAFAGLFTVGFMAGLLFLIVGTFLKAAFGLRATPHAFLPYIIISGIIYGALILPKDKIVVYDETLNRGPYTVDNVPRGLAFLAGTLNMIERGVVELISTSGDPVADYRTNPGGIVFNAFGSMNGNQVRYYIFESLRNYFKDCILFELEREGSSITMEQIMRGEKELPEVIKAARNPSLFVDIYDSSGAEQNMSCYDAGGILLNYVNDINNFEQIFKGGCAKAGYDVDSSVSYQQCKSMIESATYFILQKGGIGLGGVNDIEIARQKLFANVIANYIRANKPLSAGYLATTQTTSSFIGLGMHANSWIPEMKEALTSLVIALSPIFLLFMVTPLAGRAVSVLAGFFIWLTVWGIVDAVVHSFGLSMAGHYAKYVNVGGGLQGFGVYAASVMPNVAGKIYALFGALRWSGLSLSSVISAMLVRFGGAALTMVASQIASLPRASGAGVGRSMALNPIKAETDSFIPAHAMANTGYALQGANILMSSMLRGQTTSLRTSLGKDAFNRARGVELTDHYADKGLWSREAANYAIGMTNGDFGEVQKLASAYNAVFNNDKVLGKIPLDRSEQAIVHHGNDANKLGLLQWWMRSGKLNVIGNPNDPGQYSVMVKDANNSYILLDNEGHVFDARLAKSELTAQSAESIKHEYAASNEDKIGESIGKLMQHNYNAGIGKKFQDTYQESVKRNVESAIIQKIGNNKRLSELVERSGMSVTEFAQKLAMAAGANVSVGLSFLGTGGSAYMRGVIEGVLGGRNVQQLRQAGVFNKDIVDELAKTAKEAELKSLSTTISEMKDEGFSYNEMENFFAKEGADSLRKFMRMDRYTQDLSKGYKQRLESDVVTWYANELNISEGEALYKLNRMSTADQKEVFKAFLLNDTDLLKGRNEVLSKGGEILRNKEMFEKRHKHEAGSFNEVKDRVEVNVGATAINNIRNGNFNIRPPQRVNKGSDINKQNLVGFPNEKGINFLLNFSVGSPYANWLTDKEKGDYFFEKWDQIMKGKRFEVPENVKPKDVELEPAEKVWLLGPDESPGDHVGNTTSQTHQVTANSKMANEINIKEIVNQMGKAQELAQKVDLEKAINARFKDTKKLKDILGGGSKDILGALRR